MTDPIVDFADIEAAARRLAPYAVRTPVLESALLNARMGRRVLLKPELLQRTGSFKFRGAMNFLLQLDAPARARGVVAFSSGNHAQGVACAASLLDIPATIVMPADAPESKIAGTRSYGPRIVFYDRLHDDREAIAARLAEESGAAILKPFDDPHVMAGQGTAGKEFAEQAAEAGIALETVLVPCSGGGLVTGIGLAFAQLAPAANVLAVEPDNFDGMGRSLRAGRREAAPGGPLSLADALMATLPGAVPFKAAQSVLAGGLAVRDEDLERAVAFSARALKLVVEPGGAAGLAALLAGQVPGTGPVGVVLSGGNCDLDLLNRCCGRFPES